MFLVVTCVENWFVKSNNGIEKLTARRICTTKATSRPTNLEHVVAGS